jgi:hypothetical protein
VGGEGGRVFSGGGDRLLDEDASSAGVERSEGVGDVATGVRGDDDEVRGGERGGPGGVVEVVAEAVADRPQGNLGADRREHTGVPLPDRPTAAHDDARCHDAPPFA